MTTFEEERVHCYEDYFDSLNHLKQFLQQEAEKPRKSTIKQKSKRSLRQENEPAVCNYQSPRHSNGGATQRA